MSPAECIHRHPGGYLLAYPTGGAWLAYTRKGEALVSDDLDTLIQRGARSYATRSSAVRAATRLFPTTEPPLFYAARPGYGWCGHLHRSPEAAHRCLVRWQKPSPSELHPAPRQEIICLWPRRREVVWTDGKSAPGKVCTNRPGEDEKPNLTGERAGIP